MKGIYIEGMDMPTYCHRAEIGIDADGNGMLFVYEYEVAEPEIYSITKSNNHWINVNDKMPPDNQLVLGYTPVDGYMFVGYHQTLHDGHSYWRIVTAMRSYKTIHKRVTHWMPLPTAPDYRKGK